MQDQWKKLYDYVGDGEEPLIEITDQEYLTTKRLLRYGIWACRDCGNLNPIEAEKCKECNTPKFIVTEGKFDTPTELQERLYKNGVNYKELNDEALLDAMDEKRNQNADEQCNKKMKDKRFLNGTHHRKEIEQ